MSQIENVVLPPRIPLIIQPGNRNNSISKDARIANCFIEVDKEGELSIYKRPGMAQASAGGAGAGGGLFFWQGDVYAVFGNRLYKNWVEVASGLNTANGVYRFDSIKGGNPKIILTNGLKTYTYNTTAGLSSDINSIDSDFPPTAVKGWAYLNGFSYVMTSHAVIQQSELNSVDTASSWNPVNFVTAQIEPDNGVFLTKQLVYVVALKQWTVEYFFDAGNETGSSLSPVQGMKVNYGCASADSVQRINDTLLFLCSSQTSSNQVAMLYQGQVTIVSTAAIDRLLATADLSTVYSWQLAINGHSFYVLTIKNDNLTLVYDLTQDLWCQWTDKNGNYLPIVASSYDNTGKHIIQHESNGKTYYIDSSYYKDDVDPIVVEIVTPIFDAGSNNKKHLNRLRFIADQQPGSTLNVRYSDNDYQTWSTFRKVNLANENPTLTNLGTFRKRAFYMQHTNNTPFRIRAVEGSFDLGVL